MFIDDLPIIMVQCVLITEAVEIIVALIIGIRQKKDLLNVFLVNIMTNPIVVSLPVYLNVRYGLMERNISLVILEILTVLLEGFVYYKYFKFKKVNGFIISIILNISSFLIGEIINFLR
jgi:hypothetical protein